MLSVLIVIIGGVFTLVFNLLDKIPSLDFTLPDNVFEGIGSFFNALAFFLPMHTIATIFELKLLIIGVRLAYAVILRVKSFIPFVGGD